MTLIGRNGQPLVDPRMIGEIALTPEENVVTNAAIRESVQEFPPPSNLGSFFGTSQRGYHLAAFGTKARDKQLREIWRNEFNNLVQGTVSSLNKKVITTPWEIKGDDGHLFYIPNKQGQMKSIKAVEHYQILLQSAQFGMGWEFFMSRFLEDFFTQDFGATLELAGLGEPTGPIEGPIMSVAQLDSGRCYVTGNPYYPIMYASLISGSWHKMHASRVVRFVDEPSPVEEFFGIGLCALSRVIAVASRNMMMNRYIEQQVDDKPKPGITTVQGMTTKQREAMLLQYTRDQQNDERPFWGKTLWLDSVDIDRPIKVESFPFAETPPNFDWEKYNSLDVNAVALAFNTDRQEIWELQGRGLGSGAQSQILHQKSEGKMFGFILQNIERMINRRVLLPDWTFEFKYKDPSQQQLQSTIDLTGAQAVTALQAAGTLSADEARQYLANTSENFKDILTNEKGEVVAADAASGGASPDVSVEDSNNVTLAPPAPVQPTAPATAKPVVPGAAVARPAVPQAPVKPQPKPALQGAIQTKEAKLKYNAFHDEQGRFTEGGSSGGGNVVTYRPKGSSQAYRLNKYDAPIGPEPAPNTLMDRAIENGDVTPHSSADTLEKRTNENRVQSGIERVQSGEIDRADVRKARDKYTKLLDTAKDKLDKAKSDYVNFRPNTSPFSRESPTEAVDKIRLQIRNQESSVKFLEGEVEVHNNILEGSRKTGGKKTSKAFSVTSANFERQFVGAFSRALGGRMPRSQFEGLMLGFLSSEGGKSYADGLRAGGGDGVLSDDDQERVQNWLVDQIDYIDGLADELYNQGADPGIVHVRAEMWVNKSLSEMFDAGRLAANPNRTYQWQLGQTEEHCDDCLRLNGQVHTMDAWTNSGFLPHADQLACKGFRCDCSLIPTNAPESGEF